MNYRAMYWFLSIATTSRETVASAQRSAAGDVAWQRFAENERLHAYYREPVRNGANRVVVWVLYDYKTEQASARSGRKYLSQKGQQELDCSASTSRTVFFTWHSGSMGAGQVVYTSRTPTEWEPNAPGSIARSLAALTCGTDSSVPFASRQEQDDFIAATLKKTAAEVNAQVPIQLDEDTRLMSVLALRKTLTFNMRLPKRSASEVDSTTIARVARENLNDTACKNKATRDLINMGVQYVYVYYGNDGRLIARIVIDRYRC